LKESTSKNLSKFVTGEAMASRTQSGCGTVTLHNDSTFSFNIVSNVIMTITVVLRSPEHE